MPEIHRDDEEEDEEDEEEEDEDEERNRRVSQLSSFTPRRVYPLLTRDETECEGKASPNPLYPPRVRIPLLSFCRFDYALRRLRPCAAVD